MTKLRKCKHYGYCGGMACGKGVSLKRNAGERAHWPYKVYLDEIARQTGKKPNPIRRDKKNRPAPGQLSLINNFVEG